MKSLFKRIISVLLSVILALTTMMTSEISSFWGMMVTTASAAEEFTCGDYQYKLDKSGNAEIIKYTGANKSVNIPTEVDGHAVTTLSYNAFASVKSVFIPESVTSIGMNISAFENSYKLTDIKVSEKNNIFKSEDGVLFSKDGTKLIRYPACKEGNEYKIPNGVKSIERGAFYSCENLISLSLPETVDKIENNAFEDCINLSKINIPNNVTSIKGNTFYRCTSLTNVTLPPKNTSIGMQSFYYCTRLSQIIVPEGVTKIGKRAFDCCVSLEAIAIPISVAEYEDEIFENCTNLTIYGYSKSAAKDYAYKNGIDFKDINEYPGGNPYEASSIVGSGKCGDNAFWELDDEGTLTISGNGEMKNYLFYNDSPWYSDRSQIKRIVIEETVSTIGGYAFYNCKNLISVSIPDSVNYIGEDAFASCSSLENITIPNSVTTICGGAFMNCSSLKSIELSDNIFQISASTFNRCSSLESIIIPHSVTNIFYSAFAYCTELSSIVISNNVKSIDNIAFEGCDNLKMYGYSPSVAEDFANKRDYITFIRINNYPGGNPYEESEPDINLPMSSYDIPEKINLGVLSGAENIDIKFYDFSGNISDFDFVVTNKDIASTDSMTSEDVDNAKVITISLTAKKIGNTTLEILYKDKTIAKSKIVCIEGKPYIVKYPQYINVTKNGNTITSGSDISTGDELTITAISPDGYAIKELKVNDKNFISGSTFIVEKSNVIITVEFEEILSKNNSGEIKLSRSSIVVGQSDTAMICAEYLGNEKIQSIEWTALDDNLIEISRKVNNTMYEGSAFEKSYISCIVLGKSGGLTSLKIDINNKYVAYVPIKVEPISLNIYSNRPDMMVTKGEGFDVMVKTQVGDVDIESDINVTYDKSSLSMIKISYNKYHFKALEEGTFYISFTDNNNHITKIVPVKINEKQNDSYTIYCVPKNYSNNLWGNKEYVNNFYISDIFIDEFSAKLRKVNDKLTVCDISFDAYNLRNIYGIVDVYDENGKLLKSYPIKPVKNMPTSIYESTIGNLWKLGADLFSGDLLTYRQSAGYAAHTSINIIDVPLGGYIRITNNPTDSLPLFIADGVDIVLSAKSFANPIWKLSDSDKESLSEDIIKTIPEQLNDTIGSLGKDILKDTIKSGIKSEGAKNGYNFNIDAFSKLFLDFLNEANIDDLIFKYLKNRSISEAEKLFTDAAGPIGVTINALMEYSKEINLICKLLDFQRSINYDREDIHVPVNGTAQCENITVKGDFDDYTSLNVFHVELDDEIINKNPELKNRNNEFSYEYEIVLCRNGKIYQPTSEVDVEIRIPDNLFPYKEHLVICRVEDDGTVTKLPYTLNELYQKITFKTSHFSNYILYADIQDGIIFSGTITLPGNDKGSVNLEILDNSGKSLKSTTSSNGKFSFTDIPKGNYTLRVSKPQYVTRDYKITIGSSPLSLAIKIHKYGDVNGDGVAGAHDATQILKYDVGVDSIFTSKDIDADTRSYLLIVGCIYRIINSNAVLSPADATQILRHEVSMTSLYDKIT